jgi:hypothetical protein
MIHRETFLGLGRALSIAIPIACGLGCGEAIDEELAHENEDSHSSTLTTDKTKVSSPYGVYPDCIAPGVGIETHSWWHEDGEMHPRHVHLAACVPNARDTTGTAVKVSGVLPIVVRIMAFNNPGYINWVRWGWQSSYLQTKTFSPRLQCQTGPDQHKECTWYETLSVDTSKMTVGGMDELRISPNVQQDDLGDRQFCTANFQIHRGGSGNYRSSPTPISRSWYTDFDYANAQWNNYMSLFKSTSETMPTVKGIIDVAVQHANCNGTARSMGFVDADFHAFHSGTGAQPATFYNQAGCYKGTVKLDTTKLSNGVHTVYLQTQEEVAGEGMQAAAGKYMIRVQN